MGQLKGSLVPAGQRMTQELGSPCSLVLGCLLPSPLQAPGAIDEKSALGSPGFYFPSLSLLVPPRAASPSKALALGPVVRPRTGKDCALPVPIQPGRLPACSALGQRTAPRALLLPHWG